MHVCAHTHAHAHIGRLQISSAQKVPSPSIVINCGTTGLPPTRVVWTKEGMQLVNNQTYQLSQFLRDRTTSAYSNLLTINQTLQQSRGVYRCAVDSEQTGTNQSTSSRTVTTGKECRKVNFIGQVLTSISTYSYYISEREFLTVCII